MFMQNIEYHLKGDGIEKDISWPHFEEEHFF